jgi:PAS domain S-box-containing protein
MEDQHIGGKGQKAELRESGENLLSEDTIAKKIACADPDALIQELMIHQAELEIQNEELRNMQVELEESLNKYCDLYDFSPIAYFTLDENGFIQEVNLSGAALLGTERHHLIARSLRSFIHTEDSPAYFRHLQNIYSMRTASSGELRLVRKDGSERWVYLESIPHEQSGGTLRSIRTVMLDITTLRQEQQKRLDAEERFRALAENSPDIVCCIDRDLRHIYVNPLMETVFRIPRESFIGKTWAELGMPLDMLNIWTRSVKSVFRTGKAASAELKFPGSQKMKTFHVQIFPEFSNNGAVKYVMAIARDITRRKRMERSLRKSKEELEKWVQERTAQLTEANKGMHFEIHLRKKIEKELRKQTELLQAIVDNIPAMICVYSPDGRIKMFNEAIGLLTGWTVDDAREQDLTVKACSDAACSRYAWDSMAEESAPGWHDIRIKTKDGRDLHSAWANVRLSGGDKIGIGIDLTERIEAEKERIRLAAAVEQSSDSLAIADSGGTIQYVNAAFEAIHDCTRQEVMGRHIADVLTEGDDLHEAKVRSELQEAIAGGRQWSVHLKKVHGNKIVELDLRLTPFKDPLGNITNYFINERDVTKEMNLERHLRTSQKMEVIGALAGGIAHDMNNILTPMILNTEMVLADIPEQSPARALLETVLEAEMLGKDLVRQILSFSAHKKDERKPLRIGTLVGESLKLLKVSLHPNIRVNVNIHKEEMTILADPSQIHQVIINLFNNAVHAMKESGGLIGIKVDSIEVDDSMVCREPNLKPGRFLCLTISDTGSGIPEEDLEKVFDPFFTTKSSKEGTGMGLTVAQRIVKSHGGCIMAESKPGKGSIFKVYLPQIQPEPETKTSPANRFPRGKERILFIDDETIQIRSGEGVLKYLGYSVTSQADSNEALAVFKARPDAFDVVITDLVMPGMNGMDLAGEILKIRPDIPVILCTGYSETVNEQQARRSGIREFMMKPFSLGELAHTIRRSLNKQQ